MTTELFICYRTFDGVRLAFEFHRRSEECHRPLLVVAPGGDPSAALALGLDPEENSLLDYLAQKTLSPVPGADGLFLISDWGQLNGCSESVSRLLAERAPDCEHCLLLLFSLERLEQDLPPLPDGSRLSFFWNATDMLSTNHLALFEYAAERLEVESPRHGGLFLYQEENPALELRACAIEETLRPQFKLERLTLPKGTSWQQPAYS